MRSTSGPVPRCPRDGHALVSYDALLAADGDPFLGATVAGRFVILGRLGAGSMGTVYRARQEVMGRDVAIKILRSDRAFDAMAKARFVREARAMSLLSSPHTVTVFDFGEIPDPAADGIGSGDASLYLAMELLEGESLGARLKRRGRLSVDEAVRVAREALLSLAEAHDKGIIHRDLKPDNLFLARAHDLAKPLTGGSFRARLEGLTGAQPTELVKVLDFGIAKLRVENGVDAMETQAGTVFGTPRYMSPEQAQGKDLDARSDLYTLGVLLYQMLVGRPPFIDDDAVVVMARHIKTIPVAPADAAPDAHIGSALSALVMRALAKDPAERPPTARAFLSALDRAYREGAGERARAGVGASGELVAMVHDGLRGGPETARSLGRMPRTRAALVVATSGAIVASAGLFALGALRPARIPLARAEVSHLVAERRLVLLQASAAATAEAAATAAPAVALPTATASASAEPAPTVTPSPPPKRWGSARRYRRFEP